MRPAAFTIGTNAPAVLLGLLDHSLEIVAADCIEWLVIAIANQLDTASVALDHPNTSSNWSDETLGPRMSSNMSSPLTGNPRRRLMSLA